MGAALTLIDADAHVNPPPTFWEDYLPGKFSGRSPQIEAGGPDDEHDWVVFEGTRKPLIMLQSVSGRGRNYSLTGRQSDVGRGNWEAAARIEDMDVDGVDKAMIFGGGPLGTADNDLYLASFDAYNRWLADFCSEAPDRLYGAAYLPMQNVDQSIAMLKDAAKRGLKAVNIPAFPQSKVDRVGGGFAAQLLALAGDPDGPRQYDTEEFDPFWQAAVDADMAITIHLGARVARPSMERFLPNMVMSKVCMAEPIAIMIFGGVFDRFPDLRFGSIESGVGWFTWLAQYMDSIWENQRHWTSCNLREVPSFYMDRNVYGSFIRDEEGIRSRNLPGGRNIMWSTDYPHSESTWPNSRQVLDEQFAGLSDEERRPIVCDTAKRFYSL